MLQQVLISLIFLGALGFLASMVVRSFRAKEGCATGCGKCSADVSSFDKKPLTPRL